MVLFFSGIKVVALSLQKEVELETDEDVGVSITEETRTAKRRKVMAR